MTLEEYNRTVLHPSYTSIIRDINEAINVPHGSLLILHKDNDFTKTCGVNNITGIDRDNIPKTVAERRLIISISEEYNEDMLGSTAVHQTEHPYIFLDTDIGVNVAPIYINTNISLDFSYTTPSRVEAERIREEIRMRLSQTRNILYHEIEYEILIPEYILEFIETAYDLKSRLYPSDLANYFLEHSLYNIYPITDMANASNAKLAIKERQVRIIGVFDFIVPEKIEVDNDTNNYKINFTYKVTIDIPRGMVLKYPVMIGNKLIPKRYLEQELLYANHSKEEQYKNLVYSKSFNALSAFENHRQIEYNVDRNYPINVPNFDDYTTKMIHQGYLIVASFLVSIDETDKKTLLNLRNLSPYMIDPSILEYIRTVDISNVTQPYMSMIYLGIQQDNTYSNYNILEVDNDLNVKSKIELGLLKPTRVLLNINIDIDLLDPRAIDRLINYPIVAAIVFKESIRAIANNNSEYMSSTPAEGSIYSKLNYMLSKYSRIEDVVSALRILLAVVDVSPKMFTTLLNYIRNYDNVTFQALVDSNTLTIAEMLINMGINNLGNINIDNIETYLQERNLDMYLGNDKPFVNVLKNFMTVSDFGVDGMKTLMSTHTIVEHISKL